MQSLLMHSLPLALMCQVSCEEYKQKNVYVHEYGGYLGKYGLQSHLALNG